MEVERQWLVPVISVDTDDSVALLGGKVHLLNSQLRSTDHGPLSCSPGQAAPGIYTRVRPHDGVSHLTHHTPRNSLWTLTPTHKLMTLHQNRATMMIFSFVQTYLPTFNLINDVQDDYVMGNDYTSEPEADADLQDYDFEKAPHMLILGGMQEVTPYHPSQAVSEPLLIPSLSSWDVISGNGKSQSASYWESLESPQSAPRRQGNGFCSSPTSLPYRPNPASQSGGHVAMVSIESCFVHPPWFLTTPSLS